jgi:hypothetical protein
VIAGDEAHAVVERAKHQHAFGSPPLRIAVPCDVPLVLDTIPHSLGSGQVAHVGKSKEKLTAGLSGRRRIDWLGTGARCRRDASLPAGRTYDDCFGGSTADEHCTAEQGGDSNGHEVRVAFGKAGCASGGNVQVFAHFPARIKAIASKYVWSSSEPGASSGIDKRTKRLILQGCGVVVNGYSTQYALIDVNTWNCSHQGDRTRANGRLGEGGRGAGSPHSTDT